MNKIHVPENKIFLPNDAKRRILFTGSAGVGKSTTADTLTKITGIPHIHTDLLVVNPDYSYVPEEVFVKRVLEFLRNNPEWIIDGHTFGQNPDLFNFIYNMAEQVIDFDFTQEESIKGFSERMLNIKRGIAPHSIHVTSNYTSDYTYNLGMKHLNYLAKKFADLRKERIFGDKVRKITSHAQLNQYLFEFCQTNTP